MNEPLLNEHERFAVNVLSAQANAYWIPVRQDNQTCCVDPASGEVIPMRRVVQLVHYCLNCVCFFENFEEGSEEREALDALHIACSRESVHNRLNFGAKCPHWTPRQFDHSLLNEGERRNPTEHRGLPIVMNLDTCRMYLWDRQCSTIYMKDGTPFEALDDVANWALLGYARCLYDWQDGRTQLP